MKKPIILDACCGGGGAGKGYADAGFDVVGVDIKPQPNYPFRFFRGDALDFIDKHGIDFDAIHVSPPCQGYSDHVTSRSSKWCSTLGKDEPRLISDFRNLVIATGKPYIIENVFGARDSMSAILVLCGTMFGLPISRHRLFETSFFMFSPYHPACKGVALDYANTHGWDYRDMRVSGKGRRAGTATRWSKIMGIDWDLTLHQLAEAIPPAYTRFIGQQLIDNILDTR